MEIDIEKARVAVLTTFRSLPSGYGLVPVVLAQLKTLVKHGYTPTYIAEENFGRHPDRERLPPGIVFKPILPSTHLYDYLPGSKLQAHDVDGKGMHTKEGNLTNFRNQVQYIVEGLESELSQHDVVITHDIIFQTWFVPHNAAIREIGKRHPKIRWLHWLHSGPSARPTPVEYPHTLRHSGMHNSYLISPNETMVGKFAEMYNVEPDRVRVVYHTFDPVRFFDMHPWSVQLIEKHDLYTPDVLAVWATRIDHPEAKGIRQVLHLIARMNERVDARILFLNSWSNNPEAKATIKRLRVQAEGYGLPPERVMFSSEMGKEWERGVPWKVVRDMYWIGNVFAFGSKTETFSFGMIEAGVTKNMLILNSDLKVMSELAGNRAEYFQTGSEWGGVRTDVTYDAGEEEYMRGMAEKFLAKLGFLTYTCEHCDKPLEVGFGWYKPLMQSRHILRTYQDEWIWENQLQPLIEGE